MRDRICNVIDCYISSFDARKMSIW